MASICFDVSGHGVGAALLSVTLNHLLSASADGALLASAGEAEPAVVSPASVAERLNRQFPMDRTRRYFTLVYGLIDVATARFRFVTAGHPSPVLLPRGGPPAAVGGAGLPIGMFEETSYEETSLTLEPGDRLYFYTDGVIEALDAAEDEFGHSRLLAEIARWREQSLREEPRWRCGGGPVSGATGGSGMTCRSWPWSGRNRKVGPGVAAAQERRGRE